MANAIVEVFVFSFVVRLASAAVYVLFFTLGGYMDLKVLFEELKFAVLAGH